MTCISMAAQLDERIKGIDSAYGLTMTDDGGLMLEMSGECLHYMSLLEEHCEQGHGVPDELRQAMQEHCAVVKEVTDNPVYTGL